MRIIQRFSFNGSYVHQVVEGIGTNLEIQEYGEGEQDGKRGVFGVVHPNTDNMKQGVTRGVLVINIEGKWIPTEEDEEKCQVCGNTFRLSSLMLLGTGYDKLLLCQDCGNAELKKRHGGK